MLNAKQEEENYEVEKDEDKEEDKEKKKKKKQQKKKKTKSSRPKVFFLLHLRWNVQHIIKSWETGDICLFVFVR